MLQREISKEKLFKNYKEFVKNKIDLRVGWKKHDRRHSFTKIYIYIILEWADSNISKYV